MGRRRTVSGPKGRRSFYCFLRLVNESLTGGTAVRLPLSSLFLNNKCITINCNNRYRMCIINLVTHEVLPCLVHVWFIAGSFTRVINLNPHQRKSLLLIVLSISIAESFIIMSQRRKKQLLNSII